MGKKEENSRRKSSKMNRIYRWHFHFNASHNMVLDDDTKKHVHTFLLIACIEMKHIDLERQNECGKAISDYLAQFRGKCLNELDKFEEVIPTIEGICEVVFYDIQQIVEYYDAKLLNLEVGDSPVAMFSMGEQLLLGFTYQPVSDENYQEFINRTLTQQEREI